MVTGLAAGTDIAARSDLGWGAKKPPTEDRDGDAESFRLPDAESRAGAEPRRGADARRGMDGRAVAWARAGGDCRTEVEVRPEVGRRTGAEWV